MKSAFELAMERLGGSSKNYSNEQKEQLADIGKLYDAKIAQAKFAAADRLKKAGNDPAQQEQIQNDLTVEVRSLEERRDHKKEELRQQFNS